MDASAWIKDISQQQFQTAVVDRSAQVPVVVDFWAPWCGPCRILGPLLEAEVTALGGKVELAKLDTDKNPDIAGAFGIQGIPAVKAFGGGRVVAEFVGARTAAFVREFLSRLVPSDAEVQLGKAQAALASGDRVAAESLLRGLLEDAAKGEEAAMVLARIAVDAGRTDDAEPLLARLETGPYADRAAALRRRLTFATDASAYGGRAKAEAAVAANPGDLDARFALGSALAAAGEHEGALEQFLAIVGRTRKYRQDAARLAMLAIFDHLGSEHDLTQAYRRRLQIVT